MNPAIKHIDESSLCFSRKRRGRGFVYLDECGDKIEDKEVLKRIRKIVIPPMWSDVMICKFDDGHIQAVGRDAKGRKQYIYHSEWEKQQQEEKFARMAEFGNRLPVLRKKPKRTSCRRIGQNQKILP
jgi:DNA topoisomerase-1